MRNSNLGWIGLGCLAAWFALNMFPVDRPQAAKGDVNSDLNSLKNDLNRLQRDHETLKRDYDNVKRDFEKLKRDLDREPKDVSRELSRELMKVNERVDKAHTRIDGIKLTAGNPTKSLPWDCGQEAKEDPNNLRVMYGLRDGSGCKVQNINYYKELSLEIPRK